MKEGAALIGIDSPRIDFSKVARSVPSPLLAANTRIAEHLNGSDAIVSRHIRFLEMQGKSRGCRAFFGASVLVYAMINDLEEREHCPNVTKC